MKTKTYARDRTVSNRKIAGSRRNKRWMLHRPTYRVVNAEVDHFVAQRIGEVDRYSFEIKPDHKSRAVSIETAFPLLPAVKAEQAAREERRQVRLANHRAEMDAKAGSNPAWIGPKPS